MRAIEQIIHYFEENYNTLNKEELDVLERARTFVFGAPPKNQEEKEVEEIAKNVLALGKESTIRDLVLSTGEKYEKFWKENDMDSYWGLVNEDPNFTRKEGLEAIQKSFEKDLLRLERICRYVFSSCKYCGGCYMETGFKCSKCFRGLDMNTPISEVRCHDCGKRTGENFNYCKECYPENQRVPF